MQSSKIKKGMYLVWQGSRGSDFMPGDVFLVKSVDPSYITTKKLDGVIRNWAIDNIASKSRLATPMEVFKFGWPTGEDLPKPDLLEVARLLCAELFTGGLTFSKNTLCKEHKTEFRKLLKDAITQSEKV